MRLSLRVTKYPLPCAKSSSPKGFDAYILTVELSGGKLLGLGSACPYNEIGFVTNCTDTYYGEALAVVQAGSGTEVTLTVTDGKQTGAVTVPVTAAAEPGV